MFALNTCRARGIASESRNMYANTSCEWSRFTCKTVATTGSLRSEGEANTTVYSNGKAPTRDIISEEAVSDKRWSATAGEVAGFSQIGTATHRWVKMGSDRVQTMQMQAASGRGIRLCLCTWASLSHCTAASRDLPARLRYKEHRYACSRCVP
jgi:hypothetical protein